MRSFARGMTRRARKEKKTGSAKGKLSHKNRETTAESRRPQAECERERERIDGLCRDRLQQDGRYILHFSSMDISVSDN